MTVDSRAGENAIGLPVSRTMTALVAASPAQVANASMKRELIHEVEALTGVASTNADPGDLVMTGVRWRQIGSAGADQDPRLQDEFRRACGAFYGACGSHGTAGQPENASRSNS
jgi:hypothetical protein